MHRATAVVAGVLMLLLFGCVNALAQPYPGGGQNPPPGSPGSHVGGEQFFHGNDHLPSTGTDILLFILIALLILIVGLALHYISRRARSGDN